MSNPTATHSPHTIPSVPWRHLVRDERREALTAVLADERTEAAAIEAMSEPLRAAERVADAARATRRAIDSIFDPTMQTHRSALMQKLLDLQAEERTLRTLAETRAAAVYSSHAREMEAANVA